ncbi:MAG: tetratricopeptide repeat protein [Bacteroidia bacterium]
MPRYNYLLFFLFVIVAGIKQPFAQNKIIDSLSALLKKDKEDTNKVIHLHKLCREHLNIGNYDTALHYGNRALQLGKQLNFQKGIATAYNNIGMIYFNQGDHYKALENHFASLKISEKNGNKRGVAASYNNIGMIYFNQGEHYKALENHFASLKISEEMGDKQGIANSYNNIGINYTNQKNYSKALENHFASLKICEEIGNKRGVANSYNNMGMIFLRQGDYGKALENHFASLKIREETDDKKGIATSCMNIGNAYTHKLKYVEAGVWFQKGIRLAKEIGAKDVITMSYQRLSEMSKKMNDYKNAYEYYKLYTQITDSIFDENSNKQIAELQIKYETDKKEKENKLLTQKNQIQQLEIEQEKERRRIQLILLISSLTLVSIVFILLYYRNQFTQKARMEKEINLQQKLRFKSVLDAEEKERRRIAQELHDGLGQLLSTAKLNISVLEDTPLNTPSTPIKNALSLLDNAIEEVRTISHNMMPGVLMRLGLVAALRELVRKINESKQLTVQLNVNFDQRLDEPIEVAIYRIVQEVWHNSISHAKAKTITTQLNKKGNDFFMEISDDGIGFDTSLMEKSEGIGWKNIYTRTALLHGSIQIVAVPLKGTTIAIHFPNLFSEE